MIREILKQEIGKAVEKLFNKKVNFVVSSGGDYADYATNVALILDVGDPRETAESVKNELFNSAAIKKYFSKIEVAGPGFLNFQLSEEGMEDGLKFALKKKFGFYKNQKIQVEFISANPTGPLTVGNARGGPFGDTLANVLEMAGSKVEKAYYVNDWGNQILVLGHSVLKDSAAQYKGDYIDFLHKKIKEKDPFKAGHQAAKIIVREMIKKTVVKMGIKFDEWFLESALHKSGEVAEVLDNLKQKGLVYESGGALWFKSTEYGDIRDRVLVKSDEDKTETYLVSDIAYHLYKFKKKKFDKVIDIWGADHHGDVAGLKSAMAVFGFSDKLDIVLYQFVTVFEKDEKVRMSKRAGTYVAMDQLIDEIGRDAARFFYLQKSADTHLNFDIALAKEQSKKNPVYYVQYAGARASSILRKAKIGSPTSKFFAMPRPAKTGLGLNPSAHQSKNLESARREHNLILKLIQFPEIIDDIAKDYAVHRLTTYTHELAQTFTDFYENVPVLNAETGELKKARLALVSITRRVLERALTLLGISAPSKM